MNHFYKEKHQRAKDFIKVHKITDSQDGYDAMFKFAIALIIIDYLDLVDGESSPMCLICCPRLAFCKKWQIPITRKETVSPSCHKCLA